MSFWLCVFIFFFPFIDYNLIETESVCDILAASRTKETHTHTHFIETRKRLENVYTLFGVKFIMIVFIF